jgi:hypothetical protein
MQARIQAPFRQVGGSEHFAARVVAEVLAALIGMALLACALAADRQWLDRHFLPAFFASRRVYVLAAWFARIAIAALGVLALIARPRIGAFMARVPASTLAGGAARISLAVGLALGTSELMLHRTLFGLAAEERPSGEEPLRRRDQRLGWIFVPSHTGRGTFAGRVIEYAFDPAGYRVRRAAEPVDPERPTIVFTGESIMVGQGLTWDESIPGQVQALLGMQSANLAVHGFSTDQAYLRLVAELPRFRRPLAVVSLFTPALFDRNLDEDRPHLSPGLVWQPAQPRSSLAALASWLVPYRGDEAIERGIAITREVLRATIGLARSRGAAPVIVVPQFTPEEPVERVLRSRILDEAGLPYVRVELDPGWRIPGDLHPDQRAASAIAKAVAAGLRVPLARALP